MPIDEDTALCKIIAKKLGAPEKENDCLPIIKAFLDHKDYNRTMEELARLLGKPKEEVIDTIANSCIPCEINLDTGEEI
jgi:heterodisulfide reductase subunit B